MIVLDTNVLVSGLLQPFGVPGEIVRLVAAERITLYYDARVMAEYREVLHRDKFRFNQRHLEQLLDQIKRCGELVTASPLFKRLPDPDDEMFLEIALAAKAKYLVTGNLQHFPDSAMVNNVLVLSPKAFLDKYRNR